MIEKGSLTAGQARPLIGLINASEIAEEIVSKKMSARSVESIIRDKKNQQTSDVKSNHNILDAQKQIEDLLGLKVVIKNKKNNSGVVAIEYKNLEQFEFISKLLKKH